MNIKEYISSGIIESYVLGLASETERTEFEVNCNQYPEVMEARIAFEIALEGQLLKDSINAPVSLKGQVEEKVMSTATETTTTDLEEERTPVRSIGIWRWLAVASLILLAGSIYWALTFNWRYEDLRARNNQLEDSLQKLNLAITANNTAGGSQPKSDFMMASITDDKAAISIYWDTLTKDVYLMIKNMPQPPTDKQYQLWALLSQDEAPPVDLGMIELRQERLLYRMKNVKNARAFAITLEPKGGSPKPTGQPMISSQPVSL